MKNDDVWDDGKEDGGLDDLVLRDEFLAHLLGTPWKKWVGEGRVEPDTASLLACAAILLGDVDAVRVLVDEMEAWEPVWLPRRVSYGGLFATVGNTGKNLMYYAAMGGDPAVVTLLGAKRGAGIHGVNHESNHYDYTALKLAAVQGNVPVLSALLQIPHVDVNIRDLQNKYTAFSLAAKAGHADALAVLMDHPGVDMGPFAGEIIDVPLGLAVYDANRNAESSSSSSSSSPNGNGGGEKDSARVIEMLLATGKYDPNAIYSYSSKASISLLAYAVTYAPTYILPPLLAHPGISFDSYNSDPYWAPLAIALRKGNDQAAALLSAAGAPPPDPNDLVTRAPKKKKKAARKPFSWTKST